MSLAFKQFILHGGNSLAFLKLVAELRKDHLKARKPHEQVRLLDVTHMGEPYYLALKSSLASGYRNTELFPEHLDYFSAVNARGYFCACQDVARAVAKKLEAHGLHASACQL